VSEESTTPDLVELTRSFYETMDFDWDFDSLAGFFAPDAAWDLFREDGCPRDSDARVQARHLQVFEWVRGKIVRITGYPNIDAARAAAERLAEERG
jgi:hypothetical protein